MDFPEYQDEGNAGTGGDDVELQGRDDVELHGADDVELEGGDDVELEGGDSDQDGETDDDDSQDSDYWVDEENLIPDVEVDMRDFHMSIDTDVEFMERSVNTNRGTDYATREELDDSMEEDSDLDRKRRVVLKELGKENVCSEGQVHKVSYHIGQKYKSKKELKLREGSSCMHLKLGEMCFFY
ncbi:hypothetical protein LXL04_004289 [Taraxacum kok-saghyz]